MEKVACASPGGGQRCPSDFPTGFPLRYASSKFFGQVESALQDAGFNEPNLCRIFNLSSLAELDAVNLATAQLEAVAEELTCYIRVFLLGQMVPRTITERVVSPSILQAFLELDLLRPGRCLAEDIFYATVFIYPLAGFLVASDRRNNPDHSSFATAVDAVYPPIFGGTLLFLRIMDKSPAGDVLELCSGSGVGALVLSRSARQIVAVDITARAVHFARFNRLLNRCPNVEPVQGDLYDPVTDRTFDRIIAHPPYVPTLGERVIFRDGGEAGETVTRRIIQSLAPHLSPGGAFYAVCLGIDTKTAPFEERARQWLGPHQREFDVIFAPGDTQKPPEAIARIQQQAKEARPEEFDRLLQIYDQLAAIRLAYGALVIHRHSAADQLPWTTRINLTPHTEGVHFARLLSWHQRSETPGFLAALSLAKPRLAPALQINANLVVKEGTLVPVGFVFQTDAPFAVGTWSDGWVIPMIARFNGTQSVRDVYDRARTECLMPVGFRLNNFAGLTAMLIERGHLLLDDPLSEEPMSYDANER